MSVSDEQLINIAKTYLTKQLDTEGRTYLWEEELDDAEDSRVISSDFPPPDRKHEYSEVHSYQIESCEVSDRDDESNKYVVRIEADVAYLEGDSEGDNETPPEPEYTEYFCTIERDEVGELYVEDIDAW